MEQGYGKDATDTGRGDGRQGSWLFVSLLGAALGIAAFAVKIVHHRRHSPTLAEN